MAKEEEETKEKKKEDDEGLKLVQVATEVEVRYQTPDEEVLTKDEYLIWLGQQVLKTLKAVK